MIHTNPHPLTSSSTTPSCTSPTHQPDQLPLMWRSRGPWDSWEWTSPNFSLQSTTHY